MEATLGLPFSIGVELNVFDIVDASAAIVATPSVITDASISVAYTSNHHSDGAGGSTVADEGNGVAINDDSGCYGVEWSLAFGFGITGEMDVDVWPFGSLVDETVDIWSDKWPLAEACLGYKDPVCVGEVRASPIVLAPNFCGVSDTWPPDMTAEDSPKIGDMHREFTREDCAQGCLADKDCHSFVYIPNTRRCQWFSKAAGDLPTVGFLDWTYRGSGLELYDRDCWESKDCPSEDKEEDDAPKKNATAEDTGIKKRWQALSAFENSALIR